MYGTARPIDFDIHQPNWKLASRLMRNYGAPTIVAMKPILQRESRGNL
jgi:hypothetical protein